MPKRLGLLGYSAVSIQPGWVVNRWPSVPYRRVDAGLHQRSGMAATDAHFELRVQRACLVCEFVEELWEAPETDMIGGACSRCHAPTERVSVLEQRRIVTSHNPHAVALGRLGGLKGGPARAAKLTARRRREIARRAARARWHPGD
jgi:hypothetical protein